MRDYIKIANKYIDDILTGKIPACRYVKLSCEMQKLFLTKQKNKSYPYYFDEEKASKVCKFVEKMPHTKGVWAKENQLIILEPWQIFILTCVFGWLRKSNNTRKYRELYLEIARKNGKSAIDAALGLYMLTEEGEHGAEVYAGATTEKQAWEVFGPAKIMAGKLDNFREYYGVEVNAKSITRLGIASKFTPIIGNPGDGSSPSCAIIDEYHEHDTPRQYDTMLTGTGARSQPLIIITTTAGVDTSGPCYDKRNQVIKILEGSYENDELFGIIYTLDPDDDWKDIKNWKKANPNYGVSVSEEFVIARLKEALQRASRQNIIKCKHLNLWMNAGIAFFDMEKVAKCEDNSLKIEDFEGKDCIISVDLASKIDIACVARVFEENGIFTAFVNHYLAEDTVYLPENTHYQTWHNAKNLIVTPGAVTDYAFIEEDLLNDMKRFNVTSVAYDPFQATQFYTRMDAKGVPLVEVRPTVLNFSEPMKLLESLILEGKFKFNDPVLAWMFSNVIAKYDAKDNIYPRKERDANKIDGVVALMMALNRHIVKGNIYSIYETQGLTTL